MPDEDSLPRLLGARYRLEATLGHGGMGIVYRATDLTMKRPVAVKLIRSEDGVELDEEIAGRFLREAKNTARVQHENIIEVFDLGRSEEGDLFFVMELLEGESLSTRLRREGRLPARTAVHIAAQMCAALEVAHAAGIIHRDLKPANVMLVQRAGDSSFVKVLDFGVAKSTSGDQQTQLTHTGMLVGTIEYMAPEQIMGRPVDGRTDVYSLGIVLYRMLAGRAPFRDGGVPALIHAHLNVMPTPISEITRDVPGSLDRVVLRCLAKRPEQRFESMAELGRALADALDPVAAGFVDLNYDGGAEDADLYDAGDRTEVARARLPDVDEDARFDDATVKMDRPTGGTRAPAPVASTDSFDETVVLREELSTAKRPAIPEEVTRPDRSPAKECAMCRTINVPHARSCSACGISLAPEEQAAVRARVSAPRTVRSDAPQMPPPTSGAYHANMAAPSPFAPHGPMMGSYPPPAQGPWGAAPSAPPGPPPSMWQRFLAWTGLRGR